MEDKYVGTEVCGSTLLLVMGIMGYIFFYIIVSRKLGSNLPTYK